jgi:chemotaxis regulatin CheY-phosphate phosphatase CheZ
MSGIVVPHDLSSDQYDAIENTLLSSEAGRAFLRMRDRRSQAVGVDQVRHIVDDIRGWLENANSRSTEEVHLEVLRRELIEMAASIRKAKTEISAMKPAEDSTSTKRINLATEELDAIVHATERATSDILNGAERVLDIASKLRKQGAAPEDAEALESEATNILVSCGFQDITGQRISKVVAVLRYLEERVDAMIRIWGLDDVRSDELPPDAQDSRPDAHLLNGPGLHNALDQTVVDAMFNGGGDLDSLTGGGLPAAEHAPAAKPAAKPAPVEEPPSIALDQSSIDSLFQ